MHFQYPFMQGVQDRLGSQSPQNVAREKEASLPPAARALVARAPTACGPVVPALVAAALVATVLAAAADS